jgi:hypothetical protein
MVQIMPKSIYDLIEEGSYLRDTGYWKNSKTEFQICLSTKSLHCSSQQVDPIRGGYLH